MNIRRFIILVHVLSATFAFTTSVWQTHRIITEMRKLYGRNN